MKKYLAILALGAYLGWFFADDLTMLKGNLHYATNKKNHPSPYHLRLIRKKINGNTAVYLLDKKTGRNEIIGPNLYTGDLEHRVKSVLHYPYEDKKFVEKTVVLIKRLYRIVK